DQTSVDDRPGRSTLALTGLLFPVSGSSGGAVPGTGPQRTLHRGQTTTHSVEHQRARGAQVAADFGQGFARDVEHLVGQRGLRLCLLPDRLCPYIIAARRRRGGVLDLPPDGGGEQPALHGVHEAQRFVDDLARILVAVGTGHGHPSVARLPLLTVTVCCGTVCARLPTAHC